MAVRSRDFVGIAEGIRSHELSTKSQIENLKGRMSELSGRRSSLNSTISYLEAAIAAAYEDTDEDGDPDYGLIASLEAQKSSTENELSGVENDLDSTGNELENKQNELEMVEEEKAQTLFEIQERARKTSNNISLAGGMYGAYAGVGGTLQNSLQTSLSSLTQAAGILGGSVDGASGGSLGGPSGSGNAASGEVGTSLGDNGSGTGPLSAFTGGYSGEALPLSASQFSTNQNQLSTPATMPNYHSGQGSINTRAPQSFSTEQGANEYALSSFGDVTAPQVTFQSADGYRSNQASQNMESQFVPTDSSAPGASSSSPGSRQHSFADWLNPYNYTEDGHYIGEEQSWGYKPYGNDTSEYAATIMTPAQQALNSYMQANNYGKGDFAAYSKNAEWQRLHKAAHPASSLVDSLKGTALARQHLTEYMYAHNYTQADFATFSRDAEWQRLHQMAYPDSGVVAALVGSELARQHLREYMNEHNYSQTDYAIYSKDPEWQRLHRTAYPTAIANGKMTKRSISVTDAGTVNAKIKDRAHEFFGHFIGGTKGTSSTEHSASRPINQILAGAYDTPASSVDSLSQKFAALKDVSVNKLSKKNLETIVDIAITNLKSKYQTTASAERFSDLTRKISFIREADVKKELGRSYSPNICGYYSPATDTIRINIDGNASVGDLLATIDHETMHLLSKTHRNVEGGVLNSDIIFGNVGMNEGITEMYSIKNMQTVNPDYVSHSYTDEVDIMKKFESICGADKLLNAYMHNDLSHIRDDVNSCAGNRKAFEKLCNDIDILHHYNYVNPYTFDAPVQRANAKLRIYQRLEQYQKGKLAASDGAKITNAPMSSPPEKTNQGSAGSSVQYRFGFGKKKQSAVTTPSAESSATKKDERRSFAASLNAGISLEQQKADADARAVRQQHNNSSSSGDPYKEELERSLP